MTEPGSDLFQRSWEPTEPAAAKQGRTDPWTLILGIVGGALLGTGVTFAILGAVGIFEEPVPPTLPPPPSLTAPPPTGPPPTLGDVVTVASVAERVIPSTVFVSVSGFLLQGSGSGVVYGSEGYIVTNHHVVSGAGSVAVEFADGARYPARVIGTDPITDLAVLQVDREDLTPIDLRTSSALSIGEPAIAVGSPLGLDGGPTVTAGVVSALNRALAITRGENLYGLVQTDAPIAPGSSGGALVDANARLIGITTAIAVSDLGPEGIGFAVPVDIMIGVVSDLINTGQVAHARLGIEGATAWAASGDAEYPVGVGVNRLSSGSAFEDHGGQVNDVITEIAGVEVVSLDELFAVLRRLRAGHNVPIRILRDNDVQTLDVVLGRLNP